MDSFSIGIDRGKSKAFFNLLDKSAEILGDAMEIALFNTVQYARSKAIEFAPYKSGTLRRSITTRMARQEGIVGTNLVYAKQREYGGEIKAKNAPYLVFQVKGHWVRKKSVIQKATPFFAPAYQSTLEVAASIIKKEIDRVL